MRFRMDVAEKGEEERIVKRGGRGRLEGKRVN
jgi:hypothetical protein